ncbi:MAG: hypothetical protein KatS3mg003_0029 [Candidatus Nitrosocaldaceae archaeon]|nr:MAG: hypothetical protein KatS3mg003_0029 [Candidatus Nitrosocaldaceae archaeon]
MELEEEPKDVIVLNAIARGKNNEKKIVKFTGLSPFDVASVVERLLLRGLIVREENKGLFGKKQKLKLTEKGMRELQERRYELEQKWQKMVMLANQGKKEELQKYTESNRSWILPMMMFGIIDMMLWMSMLSMMGLAMSNFVPEGMEGAAGDSMGDIGEGSNDFGDVGDFGDLGDISF